MKTGYINEEHDTIRVTNMTRVSKPHDINVTQVRGVRVKVSPHSRRMHSPHSMDVTRMPNVVFRVIASNVNPHSDCCRFSLPKSKEL